MNSPPAETSLETALLGALLDSGVGGLGSPPQVLLDLSGLNPGDLADTRVRVSWSIAAKLAERRRPIDALAVYAAGLTSKAFEASSLAWLRGLQAANTLDRERFADVAEQIRLRNRCNRLLSVLEASAAKLKASPASLGAVVGDLESTLKGLESDSTLDSDASEDFLELATDWEQSEAGHGSPLLLPTGIELLDEVTGGMPSNLNVWVGQPSVGKSALLGAVIDAQLDAGLRIGLFGLEDGSRWVSKRLVARDLEIPVRSVGHVRRTEEQLTKFSELGQSYTNKLSRLQVFRHDTITTDELCRRAVSWKLRHNIDALYVDHGGEIDHFSSKIDEHRLRVGESYRRMRNLALKLKIPVVVLAHSARPLDEGERPPRLVEIAESAYIERRARLVLGLWRRLSEPHSMRVTVLKATESEPNITVKIPRHTTAGLLSRTGGERVNLQAEDDQLKRLEKERKEALKASAKPQKKPKSIQTSFGGDE